MRNDWRLIGTSLALSVGLLGACSDDTSTSGSGASASGTDTGSSTTGEDSDETGTASASGDGDGDTSGDGDGDPAGDGDGDTGGDGDGDTSGDGDGDTSGDGDGDAGVCGDGVVDEGEICDDGVNDGGYGGCSPDCDALGPFCGDGELNGPEACDDANADAADGCLDTCTIPSSCQALLDHDAELDDGVYFILPEDYPDEAFEVYCDMTTDGGGWAVVFKNHGGANGAAVSNSTLLEEDPGAHAGVIAPITVALESGVNPEAWAWYRDRPGHEWLKIGTLWDGDDAVVHEQTLRVEFGDVTWSWILGLASNEPCHVAPSPLVVVANESVPLGQTDRVNSYQGGRATFGLANDGHGNDDACGQPADNLISDPDGVLFRLGNGSSTNGIRHLFSYVHTNAGSNASRCQFQCWNDDFPEHYDGFTWLVR